MFNEGILGAVNTPVFKVSYLSICIDSKPIVWDFSLYVSDINLVLVKFSD